MTPILFIHGFPFDGSMWNPQRDAGFPMLAPDLPGFGADATPAPEEATIESYAEFILRIIRAQKVRPIVAGLSMGGYILLSLLRSNPGAIAGAILIDTRADADSPEARANRLKSIDEVRRDGTAQLIAGMLPRLLAPGASPAIVQQTRQIMQRQAPAAVIAAQLAMADRRDQTDLLATIQVPALIIVGEHDTITPPAVARGMRERIAGATIVEVAGAGHLSPQEEPQVVNAAVAQFAGTIPARTQ